MIGSHIKGRYRLEARIGKGGWSEVFEGTDLEQSRPVVVKIHRLGGESSQAEKMLLFQREAITLLELNHDHIVRMLDFGEDQGRCFIAMEHDHGITLQHYLTSHEWPTMTEIIRLMIQLAGALQYVHERGIIHQDLKPSNIILRNRRIDYCKIVDFGCVMLKHLLFQDKRHVIMGTFPYISPEQLGAQASEVDARSDLYALGVMFYELLSGIKPFASESTPLPLRTRRYTTVPPPSQINPLVPEVLDRITMKLIHREPPERYQSTASLLMDLDQYQQLSIRTVGSPFFKIGALDYRPDLTLNIPLIGREEEISTLHERLLQAAQGQGALITLGGETGAGKTRLLEELKRLTKPLECAYLFAKCSDTCLNYPYYPLLQIFQDYMEYLLSLPEPEAQLHYQAIREHLSQFYAEISNIAPAMIKHLNPHGEVDVGDPTTRMPQFLERIGQFFAAVATVGKPLVLVIEDIHWADPSTLQLLQTIAPIIIHRSRVFIIVSYRSEEVEDRPQLKSCLTHLRHQPSGVVALMVSPLKPQKVWDFVSGILSEESEGFRDLMQILSEFSRGNPLYIIETIRAFVDEGIIVYRGGHWIIESSRIVTPVVGITLADIILTRMRHLSAECKNTLISASCIGRSFSRRLLEEITGKPPARLNSEVEEAISSRLIIRRKVLEGDDLAFSHDKIYETFYSSIDPAQRQKLHLHIARTLESGSDTVLRQNVYALAHHYLRGHDEAKAFDFSLQAGILAQKSQAMHQAAEFYEQALALLQRLPEQEKKETEIRVRLADACVITGNYGQAIDNYHKVMAGVTDNVVLAMLERKIGNVHFRRGKLRQAIEHFNAGLKYLGGGYSTKRLKALLVGALYFLANFIGRLVPRTLRLGRFRHRRDELRELIALYDLSAMTLFWVDVNLAVETQVKSRYYASLLGRSPELGRAYDLFACSLVRLSMTPLAFRQFAKSRKISLEINDQLAQGNNLYFHGIAHQWAGQNQKGVAKLQEAIKVHERIGALFELELDYTSLAQCLMRLGQYDRACDYILKSKSIAEAVKDYRGIADAFYELAEYFCYRGNFEEARQNVALCFQYADKNENPLLYAVGKRVLGKILISEGRLPEAIEALEESRKVEAGRWFLGEYALDTYIYLGEAYLSLIDRRPELKLKEKRKYLTRVAGLLQYCKRESRSSKNYQGPTLRLQALLLQHQNQPWRARRTFEKAIRVMTRRQQKHELALTMLRLAQLVEQVDPPYAKVVYSEADVLFAECNLPNPLKRALERREAIIEKSAAGARETTPHRVPGAEAEAEKDTVVVPAKNKSP